MGNMDIVRNASTVLADHVLRVKEAENGTKAWKWLYDQVVIFPEVRCPYCKEGIRSLGVWFIEKESRLAGQCIPVEREKFKLESPDHPHAADGGSGTICFGTAKTAFQALFGALNPGSRYKIKSGGYGGVPDWLAGKYWNHSCARTKPKARKKPTHSCSDCLCTLAADDTFYWQDRKYCRDCFRERAFVCDRCYGTRTIDEHQITPNGEAYCTTCFREVFYRCGPCGAVVRRDYAADWLIEGEVCADCYEPDEDLDDEVDLDTLADELAEMLPPKDLG